MSAGVPLDASMDEMEETRFRKKFAPLMQQILPTVHFNYTELETVMLIYYKIQKDGGEKSIGMSRQQFRDVLHSAFDMTDDTLMERMYSALDKGPKMAVAIPIVTMQSWAYTLSLFLRGTLQEKIDYCFQVYDPLGAGYIQRDALFQLLRPTVVSTGEDDSDEAIKDMAEVVAKKMDLDRDGKVSYNDFKNTVLKKPMLLEALGPCLPTRPAVHAFLTTFTTLTGKI